VALAFPVTRHIGDLQRRRQYYFLQGVTLLGAVAGAKLSVLIGDYHWPWVTVEDWRNVLWSGRSITGALILAFFARSWRSRLSATDAANDRFAALLPFTIATGRVGCLITGCCRGLPHDGWCAMRGADGIPRHPAQIYEIAFNSRSGVLFLVMVKRGWLFGRLFSLYLVALRCVSFSHRVHPGYAEILQPSLRISVALAVDDRIGSGIYSSPHGGANVR